MEWHTHLTFKEPYPKQRVGNRKETRKKVQYWKQSERNNKKGFGDKHVTSAQMHTHTWTRPWKYNYHQFHVTFCPNPKTCGTLIVFMFTYHVDQHKPPVCLVRRRQALSFHPKRKQKTKNQEFESLSKIFSIIEWYISIDFLVAAGPYGCAYRLIWMEGSSLRLSVSKSPPPFRKPLLRVYPCPLG